MVKKKKKNSCNDICPPKNTAIPYFIMEVFKTQACKQYNQMTALKLL